MTRLDHLVVAGPNLKAGIELLRDTLGVAPQLGGAHVKMGTHNLLLRLGEALYLEVIAPDPNAPKPARPRWFGLDGLRKDSPARLATWVASADDIRKALAAATEPLGTAVPMSRGDYEWLISVTADGGMPLGGAGPALLQWKSATHPASRLQDAGCSLERLELVHPDPARVRALLRSISLEGDIGVEAGPAPRMVAHIRTPNGVRKL
jgi:hypothetical protein